MWIPVQGQEKMRGDVPDQAMRQKKKRMPPSSTFLYYSGPQWMGCSPPTLGRATYFTESTDSNSNLIWKHPHRHTGK